MKIAIETSLLTKRDMQINSGQNMLCKLFYSFTFEIVHKVIAIWGLLLFANSLSAQNAALCVINPSDTTYQSVSDSVSAHSLVTKDLLSLRDQGFLSASIDSFFSKNDTFFAYIYVGDRFNYLKLTSHNLGKGYIPEANPVFSRQQFLKLQNQILTDYENSGYPFASISLESTTIANDTLNAALFFFSYNQILYDSIAIVGKSNLSKKYLEQYLGINRGTPYREITVKSIDKKLRNLPLVRVNSSSRVVFYKGLARIIVSIDDRVTDRLDGVVGLAPNSTNSENNSLLITGEVNIELNNLFRSAKQLELHWRNYLQRSQLLDVGFTYPYLFNTKLGINGELNLNKFDTVFVNLKTKLSFRYQQRGNNYLQFYYQNINSNLITADTALVRNTGKLPNNNPYNIDNYGLAIFQRDYDYLPNPRKGYSILADIAIGQKTILRNSEIDRVTFFNPTTNVYQSIYDTLNKNSLRATINVNASLFLPIKKLSTLVQKINVQGLVSNQVFFNELYNFGGFGSLRGFDENELFASKAVIYTLEYRYLFGENSNVGLFTNIAAIENLIESDKLIYDTPIGFGVSANVGVGNGILNLAYAIGRQQNNPFLLNSAKFHFGIVNYF
jgi:hypothetical protein